MRNFNHFKRGDKGFTLLEILIVIVILGVLAALAVPIYNGARERAVRQEAYQQLGVIHEMQQRYFAAYNTYADTYVKLGYDPNVVAAGVAAHFTYSAPTGTASAHSVTATRATLVPPLGASPYTLSINQTGTVTD